MYNYRGVRVEWLIQIMLGVMIKTNPMTITYYDTLKVLLKIIEALIIDIMILWQ